jgi:hypothetical protein
VFNPRRLHSLGDLLSTAPEVVAPGKRAKLAQHVDSLQRRYSISADRRRSLEKEIQDYLATAEESGEDLRLGMLSVLLEPYAKRPPARFA